MRSDYRGGGNATPSTAAAEPFHRSLIMPPRLSVTEQTIVTLVLLREVLDAEGAVLQCLYVVIADDGLEVAAGGTLPLLPNGTKEC
ncbi:hypothetical protein CEXT_737721 [Caerostris extrusa]|uniref:Uncharacterized protein n=1 Tax=Caerostris extrusa TaxID=172846 RepID=A0AAV4Y622_CAEEX|nr:hypothetical protein CEXT_737721 [Caerostris extrusa]